MLNAPPLTNALLNNLKLCPAASAGPGLVTVTAPATELESVPVTFTTSFEGEAAVLTSTARLPLSVRLLFTVSVPMEAPGASVPPGLTTTAELIVPVPPKEARSARSRRRPRRANR